MAKQLLNVLAVAEGSVGVQLVRRLVRSEHRIVAVMTAGTHLLGGAAADLSDQLVLLSRKLGLPRLPSDKVRAPEFASWMRERRVDLLLNAHSLFVAHADVVAAPRIGSFNLHPGPLPLYAGLNAPSWAIYNGETKHGVTLHWMDAGIDTGPIAYQESFDINGKDTGLTVSAKCTRRGLALLSKLLEAAAEGPRSIPRLEQERSRRSYFGKEVPQDGGIVWALPARRVVDFIRACDYFPFASPWGIPKARLGARELGILKASLTHSPASEPPGTVDGASNRAIRVAAGDEWILLHRLQADGRPRDAAEVLEPGQRLLDGHDHTPRLTYGT
jgi:methionyl-tRNA formyltransferase